MAGPVLTALRLAFADLLSRPYRRVLARSLGATLAVVAVLWAIGTRLLTGLAGDLAVDHPLGLPHWLGLVEWSAGIVSGLALMVLFSFLVAPITSGIAGIFLDEVAEVTERTHYPTEIPGRPIPWGESLAATLRFTALSVLANLVLFPLALVPGVGIVLFAVVNGWLIGREYFAFAARRMLPREAARELARRHRGAALAGGIAAAVVLSIPVVNLVTPLFATAAMIHLVRRVAVRRGG
jgi:CysZ protein